MGKRFTSYRRKTDDNQREVVDAFRGSGADVVLLHAVGRGVPDLLVSTKEEMWLVEVKQPGSDLNQRQREWWLSWGGKPAVIIRTAEEARELVGG